MQGDEPRHVGIRKHTRAAHGFSVLGGSVCWKATNETSFSYVDRSTYPSPYSKHEIIVRGYDIERSFGCKVGRLREF